jgi:hypothetical protein
MAQILYQLKLKKFPLSFPDATNATILAEYCGVHEENRCCWLADFLLVV